MKTKTKKQNKTKKNKKNERIISPRWKKLEVFHWIIYQKNMNLEKVKSCQQNV